eukprot:CAMPEP_0115881176 /NCGR_PEP_ID=MMETSP0287-20121206/28283_1 /TAXON_ID=412157 /ORGANISM="Chrysochromulina rotalis, Strain UIO044" /LENGTH=61 /DNA_ID=CAMNT_0003337073 /DNA_START=130 /DNA_END=315 /DNA_ORIENTATION=+
MPHKDSKDAEGVKAKSRSKADKNRRNFELRGHFSAKHVRVREAQATSTGICAKQLSVSKTG